LEERLLVLLESVIGNSYKKSKNNHAFYSPFVTHSKPKLEIDITLNSKGENKWHCWISDEKGRSIKSLFKKIGVSKSKWDEHNNIFKKKYRYQTVEDEINTVVNLPDEYIPIWQPGESLMRTHALKYLLKRGVTVPDMIKYSIGYCEEGIYKNKIIVPSYNESGILNYFVGRSFYKEFQSHKNPPSSKDIIGFELFINWDLGITLTEGSFDAIAIRRNVIPLFGKFLQNKLKLKIIEKKPPFVNICLDPDAMESAIKMVDDLHQCGVTSVRLIKLPNEKDPAELGFTAISSLIENAKDITLYDMVKMKIGNS